MPELQPEEHVEVEKVIVEPEIGAVWLRKSQTKASRLCNYCLLVGNGIMRL